jgi:uroporphyrin-III C-methyltransferase
MPRLLAQAGRSPPSHSEDQGNLATARRFLEGPPIQSIPIVSQPLSPSSDPAVPSNAAAQAVPMAPVVAPPAGPHRHTPNIWVLGAMALTALSVASLALVWTTQQRVRSLEQELVRRQQGSQDQATEARLLARQAHDTSADVAAKMGLIEARVAESALQRSQVEELVQSLSRSRDENVVADVEASLRVAMQQSAITGSAEPLVAALKQADERLARYNQPRLERVRRAVAHDLDRARGAQVVDVPTLSIRLDEAVRLVDDLPLVVSPASRHADGEPVRPAPAKPAVAAASQAEPGWADATLGPWRQLAATVWQEVRSLVRVTKVEHPEAALIAPEQAYFLRENLKLRLLNARLSLLSRQFDLAQTDLAQAQAMLDRYFDRNSRRVVAASDQMRQVAQQGRQLVLPRPDESLAALTTAAAGR